MDERTIFLSHSSMDIEKVRKIRDILEALDYQPLLFHLKCLDDNNEQLEEFIQKEIDARHIFIYCKSQNAERSSWVQKELAYIRSQNKRIYPIDIERPFHETLASFLQSLGKIIKDNRVYISCSHSGTPFDFANRLRDFLTEHGYEVFWDSKLRHEQIVEHRERLFYSLDQGTFIPILSRRYISEGSAYTKSELEYALMEGEEKKIRILPVFYNISPNVARSMLPSALSAYQGITIWKEESLEESASLILDLLQNT